LTFFFGKDIIKRLKGFFIMLFSVLLALSKKNFKNFQKTTEKCLTNLNNIFFSLFFKNKFFIKANIKSDSRIIYDF